jgi:hypothetical protein
MRALAIAIAKAKKQKKICGVHESLLLETNAK